jgi:hypothetical protein
MGRNGKVNISDLEKFRTNLEKSLNESEMDAFMESCAKELAARLLAKVIKRTPVGQYPKGSGKKGGTLRRGWTGDKKQSGAEYAQSLKVHHYGNHYVIEVVNPVEYASYVEFGHRTRNHAGWVEGKFMLTISEQEIQNAAPRILQNKLKKKLGECFR